MPCSDGGLSEEIERGRKQAAQLLCAILRHIGQDGIDSLAASVPWGDCGVDGQTLQHWWLMHQREDEERIERERRQREWQKKREEALSKLTPEEVQVLGIWGLERKPTNGS